MQRGDSDAMWTIIINLRGLEDPGGLIRGDDPLVFHDRLHRITTSPITSLLTSPSKFGQICFHRRRVAKHRPQ